MRVIIKLRLTENKWTYKVEEPEYHKQPATGQGIMLANSSIWFPSIKFNCTSGSICSFEIDPFKFYNYRSKGIT